ncbi:MAG: hypothetical protein QXV17_13655 [Candidatus Micrarchaeaceae archaeon]
MRTGYKIIGLIVILFFAINFLIPFTSAITVSPDSSTHPNNGGNNTTTSGYVLIGPSFSFIPVSTPIFNANINWSYIGGYFNPFSGYFNILNGIEAVFGSIGNVIVSFVGGYIGAIITNGALYVVEAIYWIFAYLEYIILSLAVSTSASLGIWSLTVFVAVLIIITTIVIILIKIAQEAIMMGAGA